MRKGQFDNDIVTMRKVPIVTADMAPFYLPCTASGCRANQQLHRQVLKLGKMPIQSLRLIIMPRTTDQLMNQLIPQLGAGGTDFHRALLQAQSLIETHWSTDRAPVIVFLSDGECNIGDNPVYDLCRTCVRLGKALAFYSVSFGSEAYSASLRQMANIAHEVYASAPQDVLSAARGNPCQYTNAIDSIQLADTFLGIADSLQKPRASLIGNSGGR
ncbi:hypothetical protein FRC07_005531 [Ceratobasidium sp. 392]|nr:hypothetical protein FRC07_005531 [Ceratobasidium sp. 392]